MRWDMRAQVLYLLFSVSEFILDLIHLTSSRAKCMFSLYNFSGYFHKVHPLKNLISLTTVLTGCQ